MQNMFCESADLSNEADVEALLVEPLLADLGYGPANIRRKQALETLDIARGSSRERYVPDYVLTGRDGRPAVVIEAKSPSVAVHNFRYQVGGYAYLLNQRHQFDNPVRFVVVTNGTNLVVWEWDDERQLIELEFEDLIPDHPGYLQLKSRIGFAALDVAKATEHVFEFRRPRIDELREVLSKCHQVIWKKEAHGPTDAFYEFTKLIFVKLREDQRINGIVVSGEVPSMSDFVFSTQWLSGQVRSGISDNPMSDILFGRVKSDLEEQIRSGNKKRIFDSNESLVLTHDTVVQVVDKLQHLDLHGIDEDLNGRMFEQFLNATVRGKELGQFFTPRSVVRYMCRSAELMPKGTRLPTVLDGCCGSGGFLIDAMSVVVNAIDRRDDLTGTQRQEMKQRLFREHLFGVDKARKIARIARLNMYLHGDGGSTIFTTDMLDKSLRQPQGLDAESRDEVAELREKLVQQGDTFDVVLTNPPFSMKYSANEPDEKRVLGQYRIATTRGGRVATSENSNVMFIERYLDCLNDEGELLTVIDNTVLNGANSQKYRDFILSNFVVRQVIALPFNTFYRAQAGVQTSVLHLTKKRPGEEQGAIFMAILNNVGHDDHQRETPERDNVTALVKAYRQWRNSGEIEDIFLPNQSDTETLGCPFQVFVVQPGELNQQRLDAFYYAPDLRLSLQKMHERRDLQIKSGRDLKIVKQLSSTQVAELGGTRFRYFEIGNVTRSGSIVGHQEREIELLPTRARLLVQSNDVLFARNISSRGTCVIVPDEFNGQLASNGFIQVRPRDEEEALLLWSIVTSEFFRKQVYYFSSTAVQPTISDEVFKHEMLLPFPRDERTRQLMIDRARNVRDLQDATWTAAEDAQSLTSSVFGE